MKRFLIIYSISVLAFLLFPALSSTEELTKDSTQKLLNDEQFKKLDVVAEEIRKSRKILDDGGSTLSQFYNQLTENSGNEKETKRLINLFERWRRAYPDSPTPLVALSMLYIDYAFIARGTGWGKTITDEQWELFYERMNKAYEYANTKIAERDMRSYVEKIKCIQLIGGRDAKRKAYAVLDKGIEIDPDYHTMYFAMAELLMERWHGDDRYEMISFIEKYSARRKGVEGKILYIKILLHMSNHYERFNYLNRMGVSWAKLEEILMSVLRKQPDNKFIINAYWYFAGLALDLDKAEELGKKLDRMNGWLTNVWWDRTYEVSSEIKSMVSRKKQVAVFTLNVLNIWSSESNLVAYYELFGPDGKTIGGTKKEKKTLTFTFVNMNCDAGKVVRYVIVPNTLMKDKITIKYTIENPNTGDKVEAVKTLVPTMMVSDEKVIASIWNVNLLKNPSAEEGTQHWRLWGKGGIIKSDASHRGNVFYTEDHLDKKAHFSQDVDLPLDVADAYVAVAGYLSADKIVADSIAKRPFLEGYFIHEKNKIISNLRDKTMMYDCLKTKCWQTRWGIFKLPAETETIRLFLDHATVRGDYPVGSRSYYDDIELRLFKTLKEAEEFINKYEKQHP